MLVNALNVVVDTAGPERAGQAAIVREVIDEERLLVVARGEDERVAILLGGNARERVHEGDTVIIDPRTGFANEKVERTGVESLLLEEVPDVSYEAIGGLAAQIERIHDAIELPLRHPELYRGARARAPARAAAVRPARVRQDADRQGGRPLARRRRRGPTAATSCP